jgi:hypothetical protein
MAKKAVVRRRHHHDPSWWGMVRRNKFSVTTALGIFAAVGAAYAQWDNVVGVWDHFMWATRSQAHEWSKEIASSLLSPVIKVTDEHQIGLDYLILKDQRSALKDAKKELTDNPNSATAPTVIEQLEKSIKERQDRLDRSTRQTETSK